MGINLSRLFKSPLKSLANPNCPLCGGIGQVPTREFITDNFLSKNLPYQKQEKTEVTPCECTKKSKT